MPHRRRLRSSALVLAAAFLAAAAGLRHTSADGIDAWLARWSGPGGWQAPWSAPRPGDRIAATSAGVPPTYVLATAWTRDMDAIASAIGDFDGDGRQDIAVLVLNDDFLETSDLHLFRQLPNGSLADAVVSPMPFHAQPWYINALVAADLDADGRDDLVWLQPDQEGMWYRLSGPGAWRLDDWSNYGGSSRPHVADMDDDGHLDVVTTATLRNLEGPGAAGLLQTAYGDGAGNFPRHVAVVIPDLIPSTALGQLDGAGAQDLLLASRYVDSVPEVRRALGGDAWSPVQRLTTRPDDDVASVDIVDLTGDGRPDVVLLTAEEFPRLVVYAQAADGTLETQPRLFPASGYAFSQRHADLDANGYPDLVNLQIGTYEGGLVLVLQDAYGPRFPQQFPVNASNPSKQFIGGDVQVGDVNGDGVRDIVVSSLSHGLAVYAGTLVPHGGAGGLPDAPGVDSATLDPQAWPGDALVTLVPPAQDGGSAISGYTVASVPSGGRDLDPGSASTVHRVTGLSRDTAYRFTARATNAAGLGPPSAPAGDVVVGEPGAVPELFCYEARADELTSGTVSARISCVLDRPARAGGVRYSLSPVPGTALPVQDYIATPPEPFVIPEGHLRPVAAFTVDVVSDLIPEPQEFFNVVASNLEGATMAVPGVVDILDDDPPGAFVAIGDAEVVEGDAGPRQVLVPVMLVTPLDHDVVFDFGTDTYPLNAVAGVDFLPAVVTGVRIAAGQVRVDVPVTVLGDADYEYSEYFRTYIANVAGAASSGAGGVVAILNDDAPATLSLANASAREGDEAASEMVFQATLSGRMPRDVTFAARTVSGSGLSGSDFVDAYRGGLRIPAGQTRVEFPVRLIGDRRHEDDEVFTVQLENVSEPTPATAATGTILDDDAAGTLVVRDASASESSGAIVFTVQLTQPSTQPVTFSARTTLGTAREGVDYTAIDIGDIVIAAGATTALVTVPLLDDAIVEDDETFVLELHDASGASLSDGQALGRIRNDDLARLSIADASTVEGDTGLTPIRFALSLSEPMPTPVTVWVALQGPSGTSVPYQYYSLRELRIDAGRTTATYEFSVYADTVDEPDELLAVRIEGIDGALAGDVDAVGTVIDDDPPPSAPAGLAKAGSNAGSSKPPVRRRE
jgi:hypothetical protein